MNMHVDLSKVVLDTERLILRPWTLDDVDDFYEYASVDGVGQMAGWKPHENMEESMQILRMFMDEKNQFALEEKETQKIIGSLGLEQIHNDLGEPYQTLKGIEIGFVLSKAFWGRGLMPEAVRRVINYCFDVLEVDFLQCCHFSTNLQSKRVIEKSGFRFVREFECKTKRGDLFLSEVYVMRKEDFYANSGA